MMKGLQHRPHYQAVWNSNFFTVRNVEAFTQWAADWHVAVLPARGEGPEVGLFPLHPLTEGIPTFHPDHPQTRPDFLQELSTYLARKSIAVLREVSWEEDPEDAGLILGGRAVAVNARGELLSVNLEDIEMEVQTAWAQKGMALPKQAPESPSHEPSEEEVRAVLEGLRTARNSLLSSRASEPEKD